ncbi:tetratricopeptide repeat protein [Hymenobacter metallicola]|uniref:Tetratricopeptide repeat protein n=1 Tax=Hymenobacter metallicola TaxID=2563114 RepID=A0A4Z0QGX8_9BACT|nr:tetratricopeptide repeat protein [Hymenobacter metallicola]TGE28994.1 tetratricopeptide repeat protein [Hymenobacter metallicola]
MKPLLFLLLLALPTWTSLTRIRDRNEVVEQAQQAYRRGNFGRAADLYRQAVEKLGAQDEAIVLNLGHAYAQTGRSAQARAYYGRLLTSKTAAVRSVARQQLAVLAAQQGEYAQAVALLRQSLLADPTNAAARYNYEVLRDYLTRHPNEPRIPPAANAPGAANKSEKAPNQPQPKAGNERSGQLNDPTQPNDPRNAPERQASPNGQPDPNQNGPGGGTQPTDSFQPGAGTQQRIAQGNQPGNTRGLDTGTAGDNNSGAASRQPGTEQASLDETQLQTQRERLQQMNLSAGQARQLLDALRTAEQQYLQQMPHRSTQKPDPKKPTW